MRPPSMAFTDTRVIPARAARSACVRSRIARCTRRVFRTVGSLIGRLPADIEVRGPEGAQRRASSTAPPSPRGRARTRGGRGGTRAGAAPTSPRRSRPGRPGSSSCASTRRGGRAAPADRSAPAAPPQRDAGTATNATAKSTTRLSAARSPAPTAQRPGADRQEEPAHGDGEEQADHRGALVRPVVALRRFRSISSSRHSRLGTLRRAPRPSQSKTSLHYVNDALLLELCRAVVAPMSTAPSHERRPAGSHARSSDGVGSCGAADRRLAPAGPPRSSHGDSPMRGDGRSGRRRQGFLR
jgi:hypothetical protein